MSTIFEKIKNLYSVNSYYDKYGSSVLFTLFIIGIVIILISYFTFQSQLFKLRMKNAKGELDKCSPLNIPIYGNIVGGQPAPGQTKTEKIFEDTANNLNQCTDNVFKQILDILLQPFYITLGIIMGNINSIQNMITDNGGIIKIFQRMMHIIINIIMSALKAIIYGMATMLNNVISGLVQGGSSLNSVVRWSGAVYEGLIVYGFKRVFYLMTRIAVWLTVALVVVILAALLSWVTPFMWPFIPVFIVLIIVLLIVIIVMIVIQVDGANWAAKNDINLTFAMTPPQPKSIFQPKDFWSIRGGCPIPQDDSNGPSTGAGVAVKFFGKNRASPTVKYYGNLNDPARDMTTSSSGWNLGENISSNSLWFKAKAGADPSPNQWTSEYPKYWQSGGDWNDADATAQYGSLPDRFEGDIGKTIEHGNSPYLFGPISGFKKMVILTGASNTSKPKAGKDPSINYEFSEIIDIAQNDAMIPSAFMDGGVVSKYLKYSTWNVAYIEGKRGAADPLANGRVILQFKNPRTYTDLKNISLDLMEAETNGYIHTSDPDGNVNTFGPTYIMVSRSNTTQKPNSAKLRTKNYDSDNTEIWKKVLVPPAFIASIMGNAAYTNNEIKTYVPETLGQLMFSNFFNNQAMSACFGKDTIIPLNNINTTIDKVKPGDKLDNGDVITSVFKVDAVGHSVCNVNGIQVSSNHKIWTHKDKWIMAGDHPNSIECEYNEPYLYSLNTTSKKLILNDIVFADWDEIVPEDIIKIKNNCSDIVPKNLKPQHLHKYLDGGFTGDTLCTLKDNSVKRLSELNIDDELNSGEKIKCLVEIDASQYKTLKLLKGKTTDIVCGPNVRYTENDNRNMTTLDLDESILNKNKKQTLYSKLYHVITTTKTITIDGITCYDYDGCLDKIIES